MRTVNVENITFPRKLCDVDVKLETVTYDHKKREMLAVHVRAGDATKRCFKNLFIPVAPFNDGFVHISKITKTIRYIDITTPYPIMSSSENRFAKYFAMYIQLWNPCNACTRCTCSKTSLFCIMRFPADHRGNISR